MINWIVWNRTIYIKMDLALNDLQRLICHKPKQPTNHLVKVCNVIDKLSIIWKSDLSDKIAMCTLLYWCTMWILTKYIEKRLDGNYQRILCTGSNTPQNCSSTATYLLSHESSKWDGQDMRATHWEARTNSLAKFSNDLLHMNRPVWTDL